MKSTNTHIETSNADKEKDFKQGLKNDLQSLNVIMLKTILANKKIEFNPEIDDFNELKKSAYKKMTRREKIAVKKELLDAQKELNEILEDMKGASNSKFQNVLGKLEKNLALPAAKAAGLAITTAAIYNALMFLPTPVRTITGVVGMTRAVYKGSKAALKQRRENIGKRYDKIISKLEIKRDINDKIIDSRFSNEEIEVIKRYFERYNTEIDVSNYDNLRASIKGLNNKRKLELINKLNDIRDDKLDIDQELRFLKNKEKTNYVKSIASGIAAGAATGGVLSSNSFKALSALTAGVFSKIPGSAIIEGITSLGTIGLRSYNWWNNSLSKKWLKVNICSCKRNIS